PTAAPLPERETDLELGGGLVDLVDDDRVRGEDVVLLEPTARDSRRDDDEIPGRRLRRCLAFAIDHADAQIGRAENLLGDRANGERLSGAGARDDAEPATRSVAARQLAHARAVALLEEGVDVQFDRELDRLAGRARRRDDDHPSSRRLRLDERLMVGEVRIADLAHQATGPRAISLAEASEAAVPA